MHKNVIDGAYRKCKGLLHSLPKYAEYEERTPEYYKHFTWL